MMNATLSTAEYSQLPNTKVSNVGQTICVISTERTKGISKEIYYDFLSVVIIFNLNSELSRIIVNETEGVEVSP